MTQNVIPTPSSPTAWPTAPAASRHALAAIKLGHTGDLTGTDAVA